MKITLKQEELRRVSGGDRCICFFDDDQSKTNLDLKTAANCAKWCCEDLGGKNLWYFIKTGNIIPDFLGRCEEYNKAAIHKIISAPLSTK